MTVVSFEKFSNRMKKSNIPMTSQDIALNDIKMRLIDYFAADKVSQLHITPVNLNCPYEKILLTVCAIMIEAKGNDIAMKLAEHIYALNVEEFELEKFISCVNQDDLLLGCFQVEIGKMSQLDKLFLVNVLKSKFPQETAVFSVLKTLLFARDQQEHLNKEAYAWRA